MSQQVSSQLKALIIRGSQSVFVKMTDLDVSEGRSDFSAVGYTPYKLF